MRARVGLLGVAALAALAATGAPAQQPNAPLYATSYIEVVPAAEAIADGILRQLAEASRSEAGALAFEIARGISLTNQFVVFEAWKDRQAYEAHVVEAHTKLAMTALNAQSIAPVDTHLATQMVGDPLQAPPTQAIYGVTHIAVLPERSDDIFAALIEYATATRRTAGNLRYFPAREPSRLNHFSIVEVWKDQASEDAYAVAATSKAFRALLAPITGPLYDRRWYKAL
jgi:quinol monooxygenase YgiN